MRIRCREHKWSYCEGRWLCNRCGEVAAVQEAYLHPCPRCGARPEADMIYCRVCLEKLYGLELQDA